MAGQDGKKGKGKYLKKKSGPPRGGDGHGDFKGNAMTQYRAQPLPEMLVKPGIIVTTVQHKEMIAEREIIEALEEAADELYPGTGDGNDDDDNEEDGDIEDMLKKELEGLNANKKAKSPHFRVCKRDTVCVLYINVLPPLDPLALVRHIMERCERTARCSFRFVQRLTPVSAVSHANLDGLGAIAAEVIREPFAGGPKKFAIQTATRNSNILDRLDMIKTVAAEVTKLNSEHKVDLKNPDRTIMIELFKTQLGVSVVEDFEKYKKFNPAAVAREAAKAAGKEESRVGDAMMDKEKERTTGQARAENRHRRMEGIKAAQEAEEEAKRPVKRKAEPEAEEGQVPTKPEDVEQGEAVEDEAADLGEDFVEEIQSGRAVKVRRQE